MDEIHPSMQRLYGAARVRGFSTPSSLARRLNTTPQRLKNWESRGISQQGANLVQAELGINATWLLTGGGDGAPSHVLEFEPDKLAEATRFFDQLAQSHPHLDISDASRFKIVFAVYLELLSPSAPNWVEMTVRYSKQLQAEAA